MYERVSEYATTRHKWVSFEGKSSVAFKVLHCTFYKLLSNSKNNKQQLANSSFAHITHRATNCTNKLFTTNMFF